MYNLFDPVAMAFYATVCAGLATFAPAATLGKRIALGAVVGLVAASALPGLRQVIGI